MDTPNDTVDETTASPSDETQTVEIDEQNKRNAETRINELLSKNKELEEKLTTIEEKMAAPTPMPPTSQPVAPTPEVQRAVDSLKSIGKFVSADELEEKIRAIEDRNVLNSEHTRLSNEYDGSDGRPKYDKNKIEDFMRKRGIYDPEIAYEALNKAELLDHEIKKAEEKRKKQPFVEKPTASEYRGDENITREKIAESMKTPEGREWYERNRSKILSLLQQGAL